MSKSSFGLGRGLDALIPSRKSAPTNAPVSNPAGVVDVSSAASSAYQWVAVDLIVPNPRQPRTAFDVEELDALADSLRRYGMLQPLVVTKRSIGGYELLSGERRLRASKIAGLEKVPVIIRNAEEVQKLEIALIENIQRQDLNPIDRAQSYQILIQEFELTQEEAGERLGIARSIIANTLRYLELSLEAQEALKVGKITEGHAKILASLPTLQEQSTVLETILNQHYTVRETETVVKAHRRKIAGSSVPDAKQSTALNEQLMMELRQALGTKVEIRPQGEGGSIAIYYYSHEELQNLVEQITTPSPSKLI